MSVLFLIELLRNGGNSAKQQILMLIFKGFFVYTILHHVSSTPIFCLLKGPMDIHNAGKFHEYSICGCQVINFQRFL